MFKYSGMFCYKMFENECVKKKYKILGERLPIQVLNLGEWVYADVSFNTKMYLYNLFLNPACSFCTENQ